MDPRPLIVWFFALAAIAFSSNAVAGPPPGGLDCSAMDCEGVLPGAENFVPADKGAPFSVGKSRDGDVVGWVALSTDVVDIPGYSGKPLVTLVGLAADGVIAGARVVHHSEPILLVGIPEEELHSFVSNYSGHPATAKIEVGSSPDPDAVVFDMISGATVTVLAENRTILDTARQVGAAVGVVESHEAMVGRFVEEAVPWSWERMVNEGVFGRLTVTEAEMGGTGAGEFIDLWFTIADPPQIGGAILAPGDYKWLVEQLGPDEHLLVLAANGSSSFKGSGFVRGGIFDRIRLDQGLNSTMFRDHDYHNLPKVVAPGAPHFKEAAVFVLRAGKFTPGEPFELAFIGSRYDGQGGFSREFHTFTSTHQLPDSVYVSERGPQRPTIYDAAWYNRRFETLALGVFLLAVTGVFVGRQWLTASMARTKGVHMAVMVVSATMLGFWFRAQPSVTQILTLVSSVLKDWSWDLFLMEPLLFVMWIFIFVVLFLWGRGVFCGWLCPYGALTELLHMAARKLGLRGRELPQSVHDRLRYVRYLILLGLVPAYLYSPELGEKLAEIEPFKTTFFVAPWTREALFLGWWLVLLGWALITWRPFCRYLCPLGAALALPGGFRLWGPRRRRFCSHCTICRRGCEPLAIRTDGTIDGRECMMCMECEANYRDSAVCPPLVGLERLTSRRQQKPLEDPVSGRSSRLRREAEDI